MNEFQFNPNKVETERSKLPPEVEIAIADYTEAEPETVEALMNARDWARARYPEQFPEACADLVVFDAMKQLELLQRDMEIRAGGISHGDTSLSQIWLYDREHDVHVDASADFLPQFKGHPILVIPPSMLEKMGYRESWFYTRSAKRHLSKPPL